MKRPFLSWWLILVLLPLLVIVALMVWARFAPRPKLLGVTAGRFAPCPDRPNCVCSQATDAVHAMDPLPMLSTPGASIERLRTLVETLPGASIRQSDGNYLHVEFRSRLLGFVDDVQFFVDPTIGVVHFRSASRVGYSDLGVNRHRMQQISTAYLAQQGADRK